MKYEILLANSQTKKWIIIDQNTERIVIAEKPKNYDFHETYHKDGNYRFKFVIKNAEPIRSPLIRLKPFQDFKECIKLLRHVLEPMSALENFGKHKSNRKYITIEYDERKYIYFYTYIIESRRNDIVETKISNHKHKKSFIKYVLMKDINPWILLIFHSVDEMKNILKTSFITITQISKKPELLNIFTKNLFLN